MTRAEVEAELRAAIQQGQIVAQEGGYTIDTLVACGGGTPSWRTPEMAQRFEDAIFNVYLAMFHHAELDMMEEDLWGTAG